MIQRKHLALVIILFQSLLVIGQSNDYVLKITQVTSDAYIYTTYKSYNNKPMAANGLYLVSDSGVVMFDTPWNSFQYQPLLDSIKLKHDKEVVMCISTHAHEDRTGGLDYYKGLGIKTYTTTKTDSISEKYGDPRAEFLIANDSSFSLGQYSFKTYYPGHGHAPDNIVIWIEELKVLYGGCAIKSTESYNLGYVGDADLKSWKGAIERLLIKYKDAEYIITGHQDWKNKNSLNHTLRLLIDVKK